MSKQRVHIGKLKNGEYGLFTGNYLAYSFTTERGKRILQEYLKGNDAIMIDYIINTLNFDFNEGK